MNIWNYDICVWHPPTLDTCPNFLCKRNYVLKQVPTHLLDRCLKICSFFDGFPYRFELFKTREEHATIYLMVIKSLFKRMLFATISIRATVSRCQERKLMCPEILSQSEHHQILSDVLSFFSSLCMETPQHLCPYLCYWHNQHCRFDLE